MAQTIYCQKVIEKNTTHLGFKGLKEIGLNEICNAVLPKLDGQTLIYLHALRDECPDYFYRCLEKILICVTCLTYLNSEKNLVN